MALQQKLGDSKKLCKHGRMMERTSAMKAGRGIQQLVDSISKDQSNTGVNRIIYTYTYIYIYVYIYNICIYIYTYIYKICIYVYTHFWLKCRGSSLRLCHKKKKVWGTYLTWEDVGSTRTSLAASLWEDSNLKRHHYQWWQTSFYGQFDGANTSA